jgi:hypothetical protein
MLPRVRSRERIVVLVLAAVAALRVLAFAAAFPFFSPIDEHRHVDVALKYARGYLPRPGTDAYEPETATLLGMYGSPEYLLRPWQRGSAAPPPWKRAPAAMLDKVENSREFLAHRHNLEAYQPPVYYALVGAWYDGGRLLGLRGGYLLYWMRGLNVVAVFLLVIVAHGALRQAFPGNRFVRLGVPVLLAVYPQDVFYYVTQDALSPLLFTAGFFGVLRRARQPGGGAGAYAAVGLLSSAALLTKYTNLALPVVCALCTGYALARRPEARRLRGEGGRWLLLWLLIVVPVGLWLVRNQLLFDDWLGTSLKVERMGWGRKAFAEIWDHPLFTPSGFATFVTDLIPRFWRGQLAWYRTTLAWGGADLVYTVSSLAFLLAAALGLRRRADSGAEPFVEGMSWIALLVSVACLAGLSLLFVYGEKTDPSQARPYFSHGRLISGAIVPFLVLYLRGIQVACARLPRRAAGAAAWGCVAALALLISVSEIALHREVFLSEYNAYHLP